MRFEAILPKHTHNSKTAKKSLDKLLMGFQVQAAQRLQRYPPWRPWVNPPRTGPRAGGKRTGTLGRGWSTFRLESGKQITMENRTTYSPYVQGPKGQQARALAARGWPRVDEVGAEAAKAAIAKWIAEA